MAFLTPVDTSKLVLLGRPVPASDCSLTSATRSDVQWRKLRKTTVQVESAVILFHNQSLKPGGAFKLGSSFHCPTTGPIVSAYLVKGDTTVSTSAIHENAEVYSEWPSKLSQQSIIPKGFSS